VRSQPDGLKFFVPTQSVSQRELRKIRHEKEMVRGPILAFWNLLAQ
jgi:hypothetical protein